MVVSTRKHAAANIFQLRHTLGPHVIVEKNLALPGRSSQGERQRTGDMRPTQDKESAVYEDISPHY